MDKFSIVLVALFAVVLKEWPSSQGWLGIGLIKVSAQSHLKAMCLNLLKAANRLSAPVAT